MVLLPGAFSCATPSPSPMQLARSCLKRQACPRSGPRPVAMPQNCSEPFASSAA